MENLKFIKGLTFCLLLFITSLSGVFFFGGPLIPLFFLRPIIIRSVFDRFLGIWLHYASALLELLLGVRVVITGDSMLPGERSLIMMNHRTRLDWMYFWSVLVRESGVCTEKIILKDPLKKIPGAGWAMQVGAFLFIKRKWEEDKVIMSKLIEYFSDIKHKTQILIFPEGTDLSPRTRTKSDEFARKNQLTPYEYVLHPRTTGFTFIVDAMRSRNHLDVVYDVTVGYPKNIPQNEADLAKGNFPREVHFHIKRYDASSLPQDELDLQTWCKDRWQEKEQRLKIFYQDLKFKQEQSDTVIGGSGDSVGSNQEKSVSEIDQSEERILKETKARRLLKFALLYWTVFVIGVIWLLYHSVIVRYLCLLQMMFFIFMGHKYGGFELFQVDYYNRFFKRSPTSKKAS